MLDLKFNGLVVENANISNLKSFVLREFTERVEKLDFNNTTLICIDNKSIELANEDNALDVILSKIDEQLTENINKYQSNLETAKTVRMDLHLPNAIYWKSEEVDVKHVILDVTCKKELNYCTYLTLCKCEVYTYDKSNTRSTFDDSLKQHSLNDKQLAYANDWFEEKSLYSPVGLTLDSLMSNIVEDITLNGLDDYLNLSDISLSEIVNTDFSKAIKEYILDSEETLNLFEDKLQVVKEDDMYTVYFMNEDVESVEFKLNLVYGSDY